MIPMNRRPVEFNDLYELHSKLADARIPMGATVTHIYRAKLWRRIDERKNEPGYARRQRIRIRKARREPIVFDPFMRTSDTRAVSRTVPPSHKGYAA